MTVREMSVKVGITERATQRIIADLVRDNYIKVTKSGRNNNYEVISDKHLKHELEKECQISDFIKVIKDSKATS